MSRSRSNSTSSSSSDDFDKDYADGTYMDHRGFRAEALMALADVYQYKEADPMDEFGFPKIAEDWELSQFWYDNETGDKVIDFIANYVNMRENCNVACISTPSIYKAYLRNKNKVPRATFTLFEYDTRFQSTGVNFTFYDLNKPEMVLEKYIHLFDLLIIDPPFLSEDTTDKVYKTAQLIAKPNECEIVYVTGLKVEEWLKKCYSNIQLTDVSVRHEHLLKNPFGLFSTKVPLI
ncbi:hypothetical protein EIN_487270 [Entamoeba invadens IP1]|uniref:Protein-lysine N-methyltransferase n=1 Tax=Entamoeba invadens IP1 TaxID=370355 RepID=A0A0A1U886_ENTIV|nr:hypothetical protein EIN_487270 [Entamoeba invadens IP1]ELP89245.1 hypothetical protein EIN_487270 [Entamoeba invadens IP1]|eukprot:XP_004256016.1 hypothetical protein EIN_487270 [Entamoeba invadens IP1]